MYDSALRPCKTLSRGHTTSHQWPKDLCVCTSAQRTLTYLNLCFAIGAILFYSNPLFLVYLGSTTTPIETTGRVKCRCPRCRKGKKDQPKTGNRRRVGQKQILNAGSSEVCARSATDIYKGHQDRDKARQDTRNEVWRMAGVAVHDPNFKSEYSKTPLESILRREPPMNI